MSIKYLVIKIAILSLLFSCEPAQQYEPQHLLKLSDEQLISDTKNHKFPDLEKIIFKNDKGEIIEKNSMQTIMNDETLVPHYYTDKNGEIVEAVLRTMTSKDKELGKKLETAFKEGPDAQSVVIECENKKKILNQIYDLDQGMRNGNMPLDPKIDNENLNKIISLIEQCGIPNLKEVNKKEMSAIWLVLQHAPERYQSKYIPILEKSAENGDIAWESIALMKDRQLMYKGEPQLYGSQIRNGKLYDLFEPEYVNQRRASKGMEPIEDYLRHFYLEFNVKQKEK